MHTHGFESHHKIYPEAVKLPNGYVLLVYITSQVQITYSFIFKTFYIYLPQFNFNLFLYISKLTIITKCDFILDGEVCLI